MKNIFFIFTLVFCAVSCYRSKDYSDMSKEEVQTIMQDVSERNRTYQRLTERDDTMMQRVVAYYKEHGRGNELMEAYYLLGSVYRDLHEGPKAMEAFLMGIGVADTQSMNCDYGVLTKLYTQKVELLDKQRLYKQAAEEEKSVYRYAVMANDSLFALSSLWSRLGTLYLMKDYNTASDECKELMEKSKKWGLFTYAAGQLIPSVLANIELQRLEDAQVLMDVYEKYSGDVDPINNESSFPIYYYTKGRLLLAQNKLDSAKIFFRREMKENDWNNKQSAYRGLHEVFKEEGKIDSAYKYARLQCDAVDSAYQEMLSTNIQNLHELYDYNRAQNDSHQKTMQLEKEHQRMVRVRWVLAFVIMTSLFLFYYIRARYEKRMARAELELERASNEHEEAEYRLLELQKQWGLAEDDEQRARLEQEMRQAEEETTAQRKRVQSKQQELDELRRRVRLTQKDLRQRRFEQPLFGRLLRKAKERETVTEEDYAEILAFLLRDDKTLMERFHTVAPVATDMERDVFLLMRMGLTKTEIGSLTSHASNSVSMTLNRLFRKVRGRGPENSAESDEWLLGI